MILEQPKFNIGDKVLHKIDKEDPGLIINIIYYYRTKEFKYLVKLSWDEEIFCIDEELELIEN